MNKRSTRIFNQKNIILPDSKRSQLKIQEMIFMILGVFLFFALAGLFALSMFSSNLNKSVNQVASDRSLNALMVISDSPELNCVDSIPNCIDEDKLIALINNSDYKNFFPFSSLSILKESGFNKSEDQMIDCSLDNYPDCDIFRVYSNQEDEKTLSTYAAICRTESINSNPYYKCEIAKIIAGSEVKS